jgi:hypothetical protein
MSIAGGAMFGWFRGSRGVAALAVVSAAASLSLAGSVGSPSSAAGFVRTGAVDRWLGTWTAAMLSFQVDDVGWTDVRDG